jgi:hypothetical protein
MAHEEKQKELGEKRLRVPRGLKVGIVQRLRGTPLAKIGAVSGLGALAVLVGFPLVPVALAATGVGGYYLYKSRKYSLAMTPERIKVYEEALRTLKDPKKIRALADEFEKAGCVREAEHLRKRAALRERSPAEQKADRDRYKRAMGAVSSSKVSGEADYFQGIGADGAAENLRTKAEALRAVGK